MPDPSPDLAAKVIAAEQRNIVKGVGDGGKLSAAERQGFMAFAAAADDQAKNQLRKNSLLRKWLFGGDLKQSQIDELGDELPALRTKVTKERYQRAPTDYGHIAISRRTFFRWVRFGKECPSGADLPPFDEPAKLEMWYERMRAQGIFKNAFPKETKRAVVGLCGSRSVSSQAAPSAASGQAPTNSDPERAASPPSLPSTHGMHLLDPGSARGLMFEVENMERRSAQLRMQRDAAESQSLSSAKELSLEYNELVDKLSLIKRRALDAAEREELLVSIDDIEAVLTPKITGIVVSGAFMFDRIDSELLAQTDRKERRAIFKRAWIEMFKSLVTGKFAPPLQLESLIA